MSKINDMIVSDYHDKNVDFSASDFCTPNYQLWVKKNLPKNEDDKQNFKAWVGQLVHKASYEFPEIDVIKEFSFKFVHDLDTSIGGSIDRISFDGELWHIEDIKTQGNYPAQKSFKEPDEKWITQLSIYRYAMVKYYGMAVSLNATIHQYVMGHQKNKHGCEEYNEIPIRLMETHDVESMLNEKIAIARGSEPLIVDCKSYLCESYCSWNKSCPSYNKGK